MMNKVEIRKQQLDIVAEALSSSEGMLTSSDRFDIDNFESLLERRASLLGKLDELELKLGSVEYAGEDEDLLESIAADIKMSVGKLTQVDERLRDVVFGAEMKLINNMASTPDYPNFATKSSRSLSGNRKIVDVTR